MDYTYTSGVNTPKYDDDIRKMFDMGYTAYRINQVLQKNGAKISHMTVYRRVRQLKEKKQAA